MKLTVTPDGFDSRENRMRESVSGRWVMLASQVNFPGLKGQACG
ncbi:hypothetical protein [Streptomyces sp. MAR4 CNX-425]